MKIIFANNFTKNKKTRLNESVKSKITENISVYSKEKITNHLSYFENTNTQMLKRALKEEFDVIHAHDWMSVEIATKLQKIKNKPMVLQIHSTEIDRSPIENMDIEKYKIEKYGMEKADKVIAVSEYTKKIIQKYYNIEPQKIEVVYNASTFEVRDTKKTQKLKIKSPIILFVGRLTFQKGIYQLLEVAKKVVEKIPDAVFVISGDGDMYKQAIERSCELSLVGNILFSGFIRGADRETIYNSASVFVMPSISEPFGLVALEAADFKIPSVISKQSGVGEVLQGAYLVDFWDTVKMSKSIIEIINNKKVQKEIIFKQTESLKNLNWETSALKCVEIYNKL